MKYIAIFITIYITICIVIYINDIHCNNHKLTELQMKDVLWICAFAHLVTKLRASGACPLLVGDTLQLFSVRGSFETVYIMSSCRRICTEPTTRIPPPPKKNHHVQFQTKEKGLYNGVVKRERAIDLGSKFFPQNVINSWREYG